MTLHSVLFLQVSSPCASAVCLHPINKRVIEGWWQMLRKVCSMLFASQGCCLSFVTDGIWHAICCVYWCIFKMGSVFGISFVKSCHVTVTALKAKINLFTLCSSFLVGHYTIFILLCWKETKSATKKKKSVYILTLWFTHGNKQTCTHCFLLSADLAFIW